MAGPPIYLDHAATTPCRPEVLALVTEVLTEDWGNPSSTQYRLGRQARARLDHARQQVAAALGGRADQLTFTASATEACNLAVFGLAARLLATRPRILCLATEHPAMLAPAQACAAAGAEVVLLPVEPSGLIDRQAFHEALDERCGLVLCMLVNNQTGVIQPVAEISAAAHRIGALLLCDASQALGRLPVDLQTLGADLLIASSHKIYGPKGAGCLLRRPGLGLEALIHGGGQEKKLRSGTENTPAIAGFGLAAELAAAEQASASAQLRALSQRLESHLQSALPDLQIHAAEAPRAPGFTYCSHPGITVSLLPHLPGLCLSPGSSCAAGSRDPSHVLLAMGLPAPQAATALRLTPGRSTDQQQINAAAAAIVTAIKSQLPA